MEEHALSGFAKVNASHNMTNVSQTTLDLQFEKAFGVISFGVGSIITVLNSVSFFCLVRYRRHVSSDGLWQQLLFLCTTDILSGLGISVFYVGSLLSFIHSSVYYSFCLTGLVIFPISTTSSVGNCCMISVQRYIGIRKITRQTIKWHRRRTIYMVLLNILLSIATFASSAFMVAIKFGLQYEEICDQLNRSGQNEYKSQFLPAPIAICILFLLCINIFTVLSIFELAKAKREQSSVSTVSEATLNLYIRQVKDFQYATKTFIFIVLGLNLTFLPPLIFLPLSIAFEINMTAEIIEFISIFGCLNSLLNPFVYISRMRNFRQAILDDTKRLFCI